MDNLNMLINCCRRQGGGAGCGCDFRVTLRRCGWWVWSYLPISHNAVMSIHPQESKTVTTRVARVPLTFLPQHFTESLSTLCVSSLHKQLQ